VNTEIKDSLLSSIPSAKKECIPRQVRNAVIRELIKLIGQVEILTFSSTMYQLKESLVTPEMKRFLKSKFSKIVNKVQDFVDMDYVICHFNILLDIFDPLTGGSITKIASKHQRRDYISDMASIILPSDDLYRVRFDWQGFLRFKRKKSLKRIVRAVVCNEIDHTHFSNLLHPFLQTIKEFYRHNVLKTSMGKAIFKEFKINPEFIYWVVSLRDSDFFEIFGEELKDPKPTKYEILKLCENINWHDEIRKYIIFSLIKEKDISMSEKYKIAGISYNSTQHYNKFVSNFLNPLVFDEKSLFRDIIFTKPSEKENIVEKKNKSVSTEVLISLVNILSQILHKYENNYPEPFLIREILHNDYEKPINIRLKYFKKKFGQIEYKKIKNDTVLKKLTQYRKDKKSLLAELEKLEQKNSTIPYEFLYQLLNMMIDIKDYILGGHLTEISKRYHHSTKYINRIAKLVLSNSQEVKKRFYNPNHKKELITVVTDNIINNIITENDFSTLIKPYMQVLMHKYRDCHHLDEDKSAFKRIFMDLPFAKWIKSLHKFQVENFFNGKGSKLTLKQILFSCTEVNKNNEIINFIVFAIMKYPLRLAEIARISGKSTGFVKHCAMILHRQKSPLTNELYLKDYNKRFPPGWEDIELPGLVKKEDFIPIYKPVSKEITPNILIFDDFEDNFKKVITTLHILKKPGFQEKCEQLYYKVLKQLDSGQRRYYAKILIPVIMSMQLKMEGRSINKNEFIEKTELTEKEFQNSFKLLLILFPSYRKRNKVLLINKKISDIQTYFKFGLDFIENSRQIMDLFWLYIQFAKEEVASGFVCVFCMIKMDIKSVPFSQVCKKLNISMGSLNNRIKKIFLHKLQVPEFKSIKNSSDVIKKVILEQSRKKIVDHFKKAKKLSNTCYDKLLSAHELVLDMQKLLKSTLYKSIPFFITSYGADQNSEEAIYVYSECIVKKELFLLVQDDSEYPVLRPWLILHEILSKENTERFQGRKRVFKAHCNEILNDPSFCQENKKFNIINTPDYSLRLRFLTRYIGIQKELTNTITKFINKCVNMGYPVNSTNIKEILASTYYLYLQIHDVDVQLDAVSSKFEISKQKLIKRKDELESYTYLF